MDISKQVLAAALACAMTLPFSIANAAEVNVLYPNPAINNNLASGIYGIGGTHPTNLTFLDELQFSIASPNNVAFSITDRASTDTAPLQSPAGSNHLFGNAFLTFSVFDHLGNYLGSGAEGSPLALSSLISGELYTLTISGKSTGIFGSQYTGQVNIGAVPLGATLPMFSAALLSLCVLRKKPAGSH